MEKSLEPFQDPEFRGLIEEERILDRTAHEESFAYAGLKDIDGLLALVGLKFRLALRLLDTLDPAATGQVERQKRDLIREKSSEAAHLLDELSSENISEDQKSLISAMPAYGQVKELLQQFILRGGGGFLTAREEATRKSRLVARAVADAIRKYLPASDCYEPLFETERLPGPLRRLVNFLLPVLAPEGQSPPPYGIEEGEEISYSSPRMRLPLSQAIHYLENELLPSLERQLADRPGDRLCQDEIEAARRKLAEYRRLRFSPRSSPIVMEKGFYTEWWSEYTADGELLVSIPLPVRFLSGTNLDRLQELVQGEIIRRLAGKRVCPALDRDYRYRKSLASGRHGSSRIPSFMLDFRRGFRELKALYPGLRRLEDKKELQKLIDVFSGRGRREALNTIEGILQSDARTPPLLP